MLNFEVFDFEFFHSNKKYKVVKKKYKYLETFFQRINILKKDIFLGLAAAFQTRKLSTTRQPETEVEYTGSTWLPDLDSVKGFLPVLTTVIVEIHFD